MANPVASPSATAPALQTFGPPSPAPASVNNNNFSWLGIDNPESYYKAMQRPIPSSVAPPPPIFQQTQSKLDPHTLGSAGIGSSQEGSTLMSSPAKIGKVVKAISEIPVDRKPTYADSLSGETLKAYTARLEAINSRGFGGQVAKEMFDMGTDATVKPVKQIASWLQGKPADQEDRDMMTHINALTTQKKYDLARAELDSYGVRKINSMSDHDLLSLNAEHPLIESMAHQSGVFTMQFTLLRNAPLLKSLGDQMSVGAGKAILNGMEASPTVANVVSSRAGMGFAKLAVQLAGDIPANSVIPALNFDYANRPISELPKETLHNLALMVPMAIGFHVAGMGIGATMKKLGINVPVVSGPDFADMVPKNDVDTIKAATKVMGVAQALRLPINNNTGRALESAAMDEGDNAFTRILNALPKEKSILAEHFKSVRMAMNAEERMLALSNTSQQFSTPFGENRMAGLKTTGDGLNDGPNAVTPTVMPTKVFEKSSPMDVITPAESNFMTRIARESIAKAKGGPIRNALKAVVKNPVPELDIVQPPMRSIWFKTFLDDLAPEWKIGTKAGQAATSFMQKIVDQLEPVRDMKKTYNLLKAFPKTVSQKTTMAWQELGDIYNRNLSNIDEVRQLHKYEILLQMKSRADLGLSNPGSIELGIPNNIPSADIETMIREVETPALKKVHAELKAWDAKNILNNLVESSRITPQVAKEWMTKYPDHISFMYEKYMQNGDGLPGKSFDYTARDYLKPIKGGANLNVNSNLFDVRMRSASRAISDLHADEIAGSLRKELGVTPVKVTELSNGKRSYSALSNGRVLEFDANDLIANQVPELKGQRILYSQFDKQAFLVPEQIYNVVKNIHPKIGPIQRTFARMTSLWRDLTTTYNPAFAVITNPSRDIQNAILLTDHSARDFLGAYMQTARDVIADALYRDPSKAPEVSAGLMSTIAREAQSAKNWVAKKIGTEGFESFMDTFKESGGAQGGYYAFRSSVPGEETSGLGALKKWVTGSTEQFSLTKVNTKFIGNSVIRNGVRVGNAISMPFQSIRELGEFFEKLPRGAEFRLSLAKTGDASEAAAKASDITVDFHKSGEWFKQVKNLFPFSNANLQGNVNLLSAATGNKSVGGMNKVAGAALFGARAIGAIIAPSIGLWWLRKQMGVEDTTDAQTKAGYYVIPTGMTYVDEYNQQLPVTVTVRKGEAAQYLTPPIESMLNYFYSQDPSAFNGMKASTITQKLLSSLTAFIRVPIEINTNHSFYYQQPIVPPNMQKQPTELQNYRNTSYLGKKLGDVLGISGIEGDYVIKNLAPAIYKYYTAIGKPTDKNTLMMLGGLFSIIQTPTTYFEDQALQKQQKDIIDQMKQVGRARYATPEERTKAVQRLLKASQDLQTQIRARVRIRNENPLQYNPVN